MPDRPVSPEDVLKIAEVMPPSDRQILWLRYGVDGESRDVAEIARILKKRQGDIGRRLRVAEDRLVFAAFGDHKPDRHVGDYLFAAVARRKAGLTAPVPIPD